LGKPLVLLIHEEKYSLASLTVVVSSMAFVMSLSIRATTSGCIQYLLGVVDVDECVSGILEGILSFAVIMLLAVFIIRFYFVSVRQFERLETVI
jgi:hypothetical protein